MKDKLAERRITHTSISIEGVSYTHTARTMAVDRLVIYLHRGASIAITGIVDRHIFNFVGRVVS